MEVGPLAIASIAALGAAVGSFLNVVVYRLPRKESILRPRSRCPACGTQISAFDNVPIVSWLALRGRCRACRSRISIRYPLVEALTAALFAAVALRADRAAELWPGLVLVATMVAVAAIDLEHRIVPNRVLAPAAAGAVVLWAVTDPGRVPQNLIAAVAAGGLLLVFALAYPAGMGMGDVKLAAVMGLFLGRWVAPALFVGLAAGSVAGLGIMVVRGLAARKSAIPFAPYLALGAVVGQLFGEEVVHWYLDLV